MQEDKDAQIIMDLMRQAITDPSPAAPTGPWAQGNHNIVIGGNLSIHLPASAGPLYKEDSYE